MCASGDMVIKGVPHNVYLGYYGASFGEHELQKGAEEERKEAREEVRLLLNRATKRDLIDAFIRFLETSDE